MASLSLPRRSNKQIFGDGQGQATTTTNAAASLLAASMHGGNPFLLSLKYRKNFLALGSGGHLQYAFCDYGDMMKAQRTARELVMI